MVGCTPCLVAVRSIVAISINHLIRNQSPAVGANVAGIRVGIAEAVGLGVQHQHDLIGVPRAIVEVSAIVEYIGVCAAVAVVEVENMLVVRTGCQVIHVLAALNVGGAVGSEIPFGRFAGHGVSTAVINLLHEEVNLSVVGCAAGVLHHLEIILYAQFLTISERIGNIVALSRPLVAVGIGRTCLPGCLKSPGVIGIGFAECIDKDFIEYLFALRNRVVLRVEIVLTAAGRHRQNTCCERKYSQKLFLHTLWFCLIVYL